jgi:hypothetical protein
MLWPPYAAPHVRVFKVQGFIPQEVARAALKDVGAPGLDMMASESARPVKDFVECFKGAGNVVIEVSYRLAESQISTHMACIGKSTISRSGQSSVGLPL